MHIHCVRRSQLGITVVEILCASAILMIVMAVLVARLNIAAEVARVQCVTNLKETALAFRLFAANNDHQFPMQVPARLGGGREASARAELAGVLRALSQEGLSPQHLVCPADKRLAADTMVSLTRTNVSYFVGLDARHDRPSSVLLGDRDLGRMGSTRSNNECLTGLQFVESPDQAIQWTGQLHRDSGNLAYADGSVRRATPVELKASGRLLFPE